MKTTITGGSSISKSQKKGNGTSITYFKNSQNVPKHSSPEMDEKQKAFNRRSRKTTSKERKVKEFVRRRVELGNVQYTGD